MAIIGIEIELGRLSRNRTQLLLVVASFDRIPRKELDLVLARLPADDQMTILAYWEEVEASKVTVNSWTEDQMRAKGGGVATTQGAIYYFRKEFFEDAPDSVLHAVIAHELSHTVASAQKSSQSEEEIIRRADEWGFVQFPAAEWCGKTFGM